VSTAVAAFVDFTAAHGFRYYDHPSSGIDADTVGVVLRLLPWSATPGRWDATIGAVLGVLERHVVTMGSIPVWIPGLDDDPRDRPPTFDLGGHCETVAAHLLLGLANHAPDRYASTIETGSAHLVGRIREDGLAANVNYTPAYALAVFGRWLADLDDDRAREARAVLVEELDRQLRWPVETPQRAALLTIACLELGTPDRIDPGWRAILLRGQRWDGSWPGEPIAVVPNRGRTVAWYASAPLTTAICYEALMRSTPDSKVSTTPSAREAPGSSITSAPG
jgi:hypothetical protein